MSDYPNNSQRNKKDAIEKKEVKKVVSGTAKRRKNEVRKLTDIFIQDDITNVKSFIIEEIVIPSVKDTLYDVITNIADGLLFGGGKGRSKKGKTSSGSFINYTNYSTKDRHTSSNSRPRDRERYSYDDVELDSRGEAEHVLDTMVAMIERYGEVSVADYYELVGLHGEFTDEKFGWENLSSASVERLRGGKYFVKLPRPKPLEY